MSRNLLVILSDEHQNAALSALGHFVHTPNLDRLMAQGTTFLNAYTPCPICVPARASFATGHYVHRTRLWDNAMPYTGQTPSWGHALQSGGVDVESIGKLHYRDASDDTGFDALHAPMMVVDGIGMVWGSIRREADRVSPTTRMLGTKIGPGQSRYTEYDAAVTARTQQWFADRRASRPDAPFCLYVGLVAPHFPLVAPEEFYALYDGMDLPEPNLSSDAPEDYQLHPWVALHDVQIPSETQFHDAEERRAAITAYYALISWMDHNVGLILQALEEAGFGDETTVIYSSDHGDNAGARRLWGKSNFYQESAAIPMIARGPGFPPGAKVETPVSLLDLSVTIPETFGLSLPSDGPLGPPPGRSLRALAAEPYDPSRTVLSEYHAVGAVSGGFMVRQGSWKYMYYVGFEPELYDLSTDPHERRNRAGDPACAQAQARLHAALLNICDPEAVNARAFADQDALIAHHGGREAALKLGAPGATPPPKV